MRSLLIAGLTAGLMFAGCGEREPQSIADLELKLCQASLDVALGEAELNGNVSEHWVEKTRLECKSTFQDNDKFEQLAIAKLKEELTDIGNPLVDEKYIAGYQVDAAFGQKLMGSITEKSRNKGFAVFAEKETLLWRVEIFEFDTSLRSKGTDIVGLWCDPFWASDSATDSIAQISKDESGKYFLTEYVNDTTPTNDTTVITQMEFDGQSFSVEDKLPDGYRINENGTLDVLTGGKTLRVAMPVTELVRPIKCVR